MDNKATGEEHAKYLSGTPDGELANAQPDVATDLSEEHLLMLLEVERVFQEQLKNVFILPIARLTLSVVIYLEKDKAVFTIKHVAGMWETVPENIECAAVPAAPSLLLAIQAAEKAALGGCVFKPVETIWDK